MSRKINSTRKPRKENKLIDRKLAYSLQAVYGENWKYMTPQAIQKAIEMIDNANKPAFEVVEF